MLLAFALIAVALLVLARAGIFTTAYLSADWSSETYSTLGGLRDPVDPSSGPTLDVARCDVVVLDDDPVARWAGARLAKRLGEALGGAPVVLHDRELMGWRPATDPSAPAADLVAVVRVHRGEALDLGVYQHVKAEVEVRIGRGPYGEEGARDSSRWSGHALGLDARIAVESITTGESSAFGLLEGDAALRGLSLSALDTATQALLSREWRVVPPHPVLPRQVSREPADVFVLLQPGGVLRLAYDVRRSDGGRETVWLLRAPGDWRDELERLRDTAAAAGIEVSGGAIMVDGRPSAAVLARGAERLELVRASHQHVYFGFAVTDVELAVVLRTDG